MAKRYSEKSRR